MARFKDLLAGSLERSCVLEEIVDRERQINATLQSEVERLNAENADLVETIKKLETKVARAARPRRR